MSDNDRNRYRDSGESAYDFMGEMLVECPRCGECAVHRRMEESAERSGLFAPRRLVCDECGFTKDWDGRAITRHTQRGVALDDYFGLPLWIREECRHGVLWAYNARHLQALEDLVSAELRERAKDPESGWANRSLASRLPAWIKARKNRDEVRRLINRLRDRIPDGLS